MPPLSKKEENTVSSGSTEFSCMNDKQKTATANLTSLCVTAGQCTGLQSYSPYQAYTWLVQTDRWMTSLLTPP
jgi:hypothetical protein